MPSASLVPQDDPSLLLIGAGMAPFKPFFTGKIKPPHVRIATCQKCIRTGDIENVGRTARHHTFFEMLGNFSFGEYFKREAIAWAWEFLTKELALPADKLWITIYTDDDEAFAIWHDEIGVSAERIIRLEDNFWEIGPGPCGPCSEIHIDLGEARGCGKPSCQVGCDCDRYLEIWNLVFTQFDRDENGNYTPLEKKNIDTGAGLERIASVLQGKPSNFETDLLFPIIERTALISNTQYGISNKTDVSLKVIADHIRSVAVMIVDGVLPANEGRGYVLRRVLRRAVRHGRLLGIERPFLTELVDIVAAIFADTYLELTKNITFIKKVIQQEEERFNTTLVQGIELLNKHIAELKQQQGQLLDGETAFRLYDTFGFPWELTLEILAEHELELDKESFDQAMARQRERARAARQERGGQLVIPDLTTVTNTATIYDPKHLESKIIALIKDGKLVETVAAGDDVVIIVDATSFYAEGGGQVADTGLIKVNTGTMQVVQVKKLPDGNVCHIGEIIEGSIASGDRAALYPDRQRTAAIARNHTATHLLQSALRQVLGEHVNQAGSLVTAERLRFDFSHFSPVTLTELQQVELLVNQSILANMSVGIVETDQETAKSMGATALFGEKYSERVRVIVIDNVSKELCGGTHVSATGEIGLFRVVAESSVGAGLRRIEAVTGLAALEYVKSREEQLLAAAATLKVKPEELELKLRSLTTKIHDLEQELANIQGSAVKQTVEQLMNNRQLYNDVELVVSEVTVAGMDELRSIADLVRDRLNNGVVVLGAVQADKVNFVAMVTASAQAKGLHAGNIVKEVAKVAGGGGGGRADMAQAGGKQPDNITAALAAGRSFIESKLG